jgi:hypothetical protein
MFETFHYKSVSDISRGSPAARWQTTESRARTHGPTTKSLQTNHWLPPLATAVVGRKMLPFEPAKICRLSRFDFIIMTLEKFIRELRSNTN